MNKHIKVKITGRVQGVGFRWCSYEKFVDLGLTGKAENTKEGAVEIDVSGEDLNLEKFLEWAKVGPEGARVSSVEVSEVVEDKDKNEANEKNNQNNQEKADS